MEALTNELYPLTTKMYQQAETTTGEKVAENGDDVLMLNMK